MVELWVGLGFDNNPSGIVCLTDESTMVDRTLGRGYITILGSAIPIILVESNYSNKFLLTDQ